MLAVWPALAIAVGGPVCGLALAFVRGRRAWRGFKSLGATVGDRVAEIASSTAEIETHLTRAGEGAERVSAALERLRRSRARLEVLQAALREARASMERAVPFLGGR